MADIFISYARTDADIAYRLAEALEARGRSVWIDQKIEGGTQFSEVIEREIAAAGKVVVLWSAASVRSEWVRDEASIAKDQHKLVPVSIDGTVPPIGFRQTQTTPIDEWVAGRSRDLPAGMLAALSMAAIAAPAPAPVITIDKRNYVLAAVGAVVLALAGVLYFTLGRDGDAATLAEGERIAVVVKPFAASAGAAPGELALAQGITDELVIRLRSIPELRIATADAQGNVPGSAFTGAYLVEGNIRQQGEQLRATASLRRSDGEIVWTDSFERPLKDIFYVQEDLATAIAGVLSVSLEVGEDAAGYDGTTNPAAFAAFTQGLASQPLGDWERTIGYFERALELDPDYGRATAQLGTALAVRLVGSPLRDQAEADAIVARITDLAERSLEQHPESFLSQTNGIQMALAKKDYVAVARYGVRAKEIGFPDHISVNTQYSLYLMALGLSEDIKDLQSRTALIEPNMRNIPFFIWPPILYRDYDEVIERFERAVRQGQQPGPFANHVVLAYWLKGERDKAMEIARQYYPPMAQRLEAAESGSPQSTMSMPKLREWVTGEMGVGGQELAMNYAVAEAAHGNDEAAMRLIRLAMERPGGNMTFMLWHPIFDNVRKRPEFVRLIEEMGIVDAWRESGEWSDWCRPLGQDGVTCT